ncbi:TlyA family RNA methyltransferase [Lichenihabitans sp. Uapishka_5]|uniref:TlyA family RNA methyltransferase n=1 Tax=Lichenihabitans sp. Uapishka_5 TaxID=3037302 RepID=UPI0029E7F0C0|nr:TlyA family RNA methyltransferase [Lichenihabitans sp. Uapishka_5]MDX7950422.1 TlyA family RNA methyltransferase [Lichenihabitans sp. Uapishka_5]
MSLVEAGFFESRAKAQEAIAAGLVAVDGRVLHRPSDRVPPGARLTATAPHPWVSRGGLKLVAALDGFGVNPRGRTCLDIGASTGGFTDVLLSRGAARVHAVDVGHGQLHPRLKADPRVEDLSGTDARQLSAAMFPVGPTLIVCDASFISLALVLPPVLRLAAPGAALITLVKPQFEVGKGQTDKGIVRDDEQRQAVCARVARLVEDLGWRLGGLLTSPITGRDGNVEFLLHATAP